MIVIVANEKKKVLQNYEMLKEIVANEKEITVIVVNKKKKVLQNYKMLKMTVIVAYEERLMLEIN